LRVVSKTEGNFTECLNEILDVKLTSVLACAWVPSTCFAWVQSEALEDCDLERLIFSACTIREVAYAGKISTPHDGIRLNASVATLQRFHWSDEARHKVNYQLPVCRWP
jgi:hypothetical protein